MNASEKFKFVHNQIVEPLRQECEAEIKETEKLVTRKFKYNSFEISFSDRQKRAQSLAKLSWRNRRQSFRNDQSQTKNWSNNTAKELKKNRSIY